MPTSATFSEIRLEIYRQEIVEAQRIVAWIAIPQYSHNPLWHQIRYYTLPVISSCLAKHELL
jgi:hypothetical protein